MDLVSRHLVLHGSLVLLFALLLGAPYARAIKRHADAQVVNSWRVAHQSLSIGALLLLGLAPVLNAMPVANGLKWAIAVPMIVSGYAFCVATPMAAITKDRGLSSGAKGWARCVYLGNILGAMSSLMGAVLLVGAALAAF
ncbi:hypothetical protein [Rhodoferax sp.]|uniref:hypothetical protein n=1 Tax=Rhodoferax sp. TaxID=50421 RepID=UPI002ACEF4C7|nr:hypothetical protein [Rhodoferax sp.]MDZ7920451.1 hypothetical protein [Rhodoferax sp.]